MLKLKSKPCQIGASINARTEKHGDEPQPAMDIPLSFLISAKELNALMGDPHTSDVWFEATPGELPEPMLKNLKPYKLKGKFKDSLAVLTVGVNGHVIDLGDCTLSGLAFEPQTGGMTAVKLKVQCLITSKTTDVFLWMDREGDVELQFGEMDGNANQEELDLEVPEEAPKPKRKAKGTKEDRASLN